MVLKNDDHNFMKTKNLLIKVVCFLKKSVVKTKFDSVRFLAALFIIVFMIDMSANAQTYYLGVLAPQGEVAAQKRWQPWLDALNQQLGGDTIVMVPLALENWQQQIAADKFALVLGPQVQFTKMETKGWRWLATLDSQKSQNTPSAMEQVASALWVTKDSKIYKLTDIKGKRIAAVDQDAFGGYLLIAHLLAQNGIKAAEYQTQFVGFPIENTLLTLATGQADAAIAPICLMEEMGRQGRIQPRDFRLLNPVMTTSYCQSSTDIYPNWTLAATNKLPNALLSPLNQSLFHPNLAAKNLPNWLPPESNRAAEQILYDMNQHPAQQPITKQLYHWVLEHRLWVGLALLVMVISLINYAWMSALALRRRRLLIAKNQLIRDYDDALKKSSHFVIMGEMSGAIAHEINQPLATIQNYAQGLMIRQQKSRLNPPSEKDNQVLTTALQEIIAETERASNIIQNIKSWVKGSGQANAQANQAETLVDIISVYQHCILLLGNKASNIRFYFAGEVTSLRLPNLVLDQLLMNTLLNATEQRATLILLRCQIIGDNSTKKLGIFISDNAGGFLPEQLSKKTFGISKITSTKTDGLGLGLMICQRLCQSLDGKLVLNNIVINHEIKSADPVYYQIIANSLLDVSRRQLALNPENIAPKCPSKLKIGAQIAMYFPLTVIDNLPSTSSKKGQS